MDLQLRIAQVTDVKDGLCGGIERHVLNLAIAQKARGDKPIVVVPESGGLAAACYEYGIQVTIETEVFERLKKIRKMIDDRATDDMYDRTIDGSYDRAIDDLCALLVKFGVEVIHCHTPPLGTAAIAAGNRIGIPCVYTQHIGNGFKIPNLRFAVIGVCRSALERMKKDGFPEGKLYYVPNGTKAMPRVTNGSSRPSLISVGRLVFVKGHDIAILAMAELKRRHGVDHCPVLNIYGAGPLEGYLKEMVSVLRLDDTVRFHGAQPGILERCPGTDILIVSARAETGPMTALEAMSRGMPIVAFRVGEIEDMIPDRRYGYIARNISITALADGIDSMLSDVHAGRFNPDLPISRHRAFYTVEKMAERVDVIYKSLIARPVVAGPGTPR